MEYLNELNALIGGLIVLAGLAITLWDRYITARKTLQKATDIIQKARILKKTAEDVRNDFAAAEKKMTPRQKKSLQGIVRKSQQKYEWMKETYGRGGAPQGGN